MFLQHLKPYKCMGVDHIFIFHMYIYLYQKKMVMFALFLTLYLRSDMSYLSVDIKFIFVAPLVFEI